MTNSKYQIQFDFQVLEFYKAFSQSFSRNLLLTYNLRHRVRIIFYHLLVSAKTFQYRMFLLTFSLSIVTFLPTHGHHGVFPERFFFKSFYIELETLTCDHLKNLKKHLELEKVLTKIGIRKACFIINVLCSLQLIIDVNYISVDFSQSV